MALDIQISMDFGGARRLINLPDALADQEPATYAQLKRAIEGLAQKDEVRVASTANINLASPGATIDSVTMAANDRVLVKNNTTQTENGIYIWNGAATPMTRSADASTFDELESAIVPVSEGTVNIGTVWRQTAINGVIGVNNVLWVGFGTVGVQATETTLGVAEIATQAETDAGTDDLRFITPLKFKSSSFAARKASGNIGDGASLTYDVSHSFNTYDVLVEVFRNSGNRDTVEVGWHRLNTNTVRFTFDTAPSSAQFRAIIWG